MSKPFIVIRDDGYSPFHDGEDEIYSPEMFLKLTVDYLAEYPDVQVKEFGVGPGSVFTYDTKVGELFLEGASEEALKLQTKRSMHIYRQVKHIMSFGSDPMTLVVNRCHEIGIKCWARFEVNHEYGPAADDYERWGGFVGSFNKKHPEYRIPGTVNLDFAIKEVRDFKLAIIKELLEHDVDGISLDFCVYPPFLADPENDYHYITEFIRDVRALCDTVTHKHVSVILRTPYDSEKIGVHWRDMVEYLDYIIPSVVWMNTCWDVPNEEFVNATKGTNCEVLTCIRPFTGTVNCDEDPDDVRSGIIRSETPNTVNAIYAKSYLGLVNGSAGIQLALGAGSITKGQYESDTLPTYAYKGNHWRKEYANLANMDFLKKQDKDYTFNSLDILPADLTLEEPEIELPLRIADEPKDIKSATFRILSRGLSIKEELVLSINGHEMILTDKELKWSPLEQPILPKRGSTGMIEENLYLIFRIPEWWEIGKTDLSIPPEWLIKGKNIFKFTYRVKDNAKPAQPYFRFGEMKVLLKIDAE